MKFARVLAAMLLILSLLAGAASFARALLAPNETKITEIAPGVFFRKTQTAPKFLGCNQGWVVFKDYVLVIDANFPNQADEVVKVIREHTNKPIRYVFDTHYHGDHADGNMRYVGASPVASERARLEFQTKGVAGFENSKKSNPGEYGELTYKQPDLYFPNKLVLDDGEQRVELIHFGHGHTLGDAVAWIPKHGILFTGDACVNGAFNYTGDGNTESWISVLTTMEELPVKTVAPGHGELAGKELLGKQKRYFIELRTAIKRMIDEGMKLDEIKQKIDVPFYKEWTGVDVKTRSENIEHVFKELTSG